MCTNINARVRDEKTYTLKAERAVAADTATDEEHYLVRSRPNK
jgi:hypothetical protein